MNRRVKACLLGAFLGLLMARHAGAQDFPTKPVRIITPFPVGSGPEGVLHMAADKLSRTWGKHVMVFVVRLRVVPADTRAV